MKGVILGLCPEAVVVDLTHEVPRHDILAGQLALQAAHPFFPPGTVHVGVVDPGVGGRRRVLAIRSGGRCHVGPDNGLFTFALVGDWEAVSIESAAHRRPEVSATFHGRDVFAPAAAYLACGGDLGALGPPAPDPVCLEIPRARREGGELVGEVIGADHFGNAVTSVTAGDLASLGPGPVCVRVGGVVLGAPVEAYSEVVPGAPGSILGSQGRLEIFVREGSAEAILGLTRGTRVRAGP